MRMFGSARLSVFGSVISLRKIVALIGRFTMTSETISKLPREALIQWRRILRQEIAKCINTQRNNVNTLRKVQSELSRRKK
jgi:hypothetical protein